MSDFDWSDEPVDPIREAADPVSERLAGMVEKFARTATEYKKSEDARKAAEVADLFTGASVDLTAGKDSDTLKRALDRAERDYRADPTNEGAKQAAYAAELAYNTALEREDFRGRSDDQLAVDRTDIEFRIEELEHGIAALEAEGKPVAAQKATQQLLEARVEVKGIDQELASRGQDRIIREHVAAKALSAVAEHYAKQDWALLQDAELEGPAAVEEARRLIASTPLEARKGYEERVRAEVKKARAAFQDGVIDTYAQLASNGTVQRKAKPFDGASDEELVERAVGEPKGLAYGVMKG